MRKRSILIITLLLICVVASSCSFGASPKGRTETIQGMSIVVPDRFKDFGNSTYYDSGNTETIKLAFMETDKTPEEMIKILYEGVPGAETVYSEVCNYKTAITTWSSYNMYMNKLFHKTYSIFADGKIYEITFSNPANEFSDEKIIQTVSFTQ